VGSALPRCLVLGSERLTVGPTPTASAESKTTRNNSKNSVSGRIGREIPAASTGCGSHPRWRERASRSARTSGRAGPAHHRACPGRPLVPASCAGASAGRRYRHRFRAVSRVEMCRSLKFRFRENGLGFRHAAPVASKGGLEPVQRYRSRPTTIIGIRHARPRVAVMHEETGLASGGSANEQEAESLAPLRRLIACSGDRRVLARGDNSR
jgi:hypothetical protein